MEHVIELHVYLPSRTFVKLTYIPTSLYSINDQQFAHSTFVYHIYMSVYMSLDTD